jgi:hypothetical protein
MDNNMYRVPSVVEQVASAIPRNASDCYLAIIQQHSDGLIPIDRDDVGFQLDGPDQSSDNVASSSTNNEKRKQDSSNNK